MEKKVKDNFPLMKTVAFIEKEMDRRGWNKARLVEHSGISSRAATCFFQDGKINSENTFRILRALNLFSIDETARSGTISPHSDLLEMAESVLTRGDKKARQELLHTISRLHQAMEVSNSSAGDVPLIGGGGTAAM